MRALQTVSGLDRLGRAPNLLRLGVFGAVATGEVLLASLLFDFVIPHDRSLWLSPVLWANAAAQAAMVAFLFLVMVGLPRRAEIIEAHSRTSAASVLHLALATNLALFLALLFARYTLSQMAEPSLGALVLYSLLLLMTGASMAFVAAPLSFWRWLVKLLPLEVLIAGAGGIFAVGAGKLAQEGWSTLSDATLTLSHWFLRLYEQNVFLDTGERILGVGDFRVQVYETCSGYEGVALIIAFLSVYTWVFRRNLRFPNALLLFPIGIAAIWVLNALRIAILVSIGAHVSPGVAIQGFHSQAGWISFLIVTLSCIAVSRKVSFFAPQAAPVAVAVREADTDTDPGARASLEYLAPFIALVSASILASAFIPHDQWLYGVKVAAIAGALWWFRSAYLPLVSAVSLSSIAIGLAVGVVWIATDPNRGATSSLGLWIASLQVWVAVVWLALRAFGSIVLVPIAEELAFRGFVYRALISAKFETVGFGEFRLLALIGSSLAFGAVHQRWGAAFLAGLVYALLMYRSKRLSDPIAAHAASNAAIMAWAIATEQWSLI